MCIDVEVDCLLELGEKLGDVCMYVLVELLLMRKCSTNQTVLHLARGSVVTALAANHVM